MNVEYALEGNPQKPIIYFWRRENGKRICHRIEDFQPYFYILEEEKTDDPRITGTQSGFKSITDEACKKVYVKLPKHVKELRGLFKKSFECDIQYTKRYVIDNNLDFGSEFSISFVDIEVYDKNGFPKPEEAKEQILAISVFDTHLQKYWTLYMDTKETVEERTRIGIVDKKEYPWLIKSYTKEKDMLEALISLLNHCDPDVLSGWNSYRFDWEYLINRMKRLHVDYKKLSPLGRVKESSSRPGLLTPREKVLEQMDVAGRLFFDCLDAYKRIQRKGIESYRLEAVAKKELGVGKAYRAKHVADMTKAELIEYNVMDVELTKEIEVKRNVIKYFWDMSNFVKCWITQTKSYARIIDTIMLRKKGDTVFPTNVIATRKPKYQGATVLDAPAGKFRNVVVFDLTSLYPSLIMSANISPETVVDREHADVYIDELGIYVSTKKEGFIPRVMRELFEERDKYRKILESGQFKRGTDDWTLAWNKSEFLKQGANSVFGTLSYEGFRLYVPKLSELTTFLGRKTIEWTNKIANQNGYQVIYSDTDSAFLIGWKATTPEGIMAESEILRDKINKSYAEFMLQYGIKNHRLSIKSEELFDVLVFGGKKKRYFGKIVYKRGEKIDLIEVAGFEMKRSDYSNFTRSMQKELITMICNGANEKDVRDFITKKIEEIKTTDLMDIAVPKSLSLSLDKYMTASNVVKAAMYSNKYLGKNYDCGDKPRYVPIIKPRMDLPTHQMVKNPKTGIEERKKVEAVLFDDPVDVEGFMINYDELIEKHICNKVNPILEMVGYRPVEADIKQTNMERWFE